MHIKYKHSARSLSHSEMGVIRGAQMSIRIVAEKNYKKKIFFVKKEKIRRPMIILVEEVISPIVDATSCPSYDLPKLQLVYLSFP